VQADVALERAAPVVRDRSKPPAADPILCA
jgi:hypothetical protein